jgi:hypothetical protein
MHLAVAQSIHGKQMELRQKTHAIRKKRVELCAMSRFEIHRAIGDVLFRIGGLLSSFATLSPWNQDKLGASKGLSLPLNRRLQNGFMRDALYGS